MLPLVGSVPVIDYTLQKGGYILEPATVTIANVLTAMTTVLQSFYSMFTSVITTITGNALLYVPVLFGLLFALITVAISVVRKLGVRGVSASGLSGC